MLAEAEYFLKRGHEVTMLLNDLDRSAFGDRLGRIDVKVVPLASMWDIRGLWRYRQTLLGEDPDVVIAHESTQELLVPALLGTNVPYYFHRHDSPFWFTDDDRIYSWLYRDIFDEIRESNPGHRLFIEPDRSFTVTGRAELEVKSVADFVGTRGSEAVFTICERSRWELASMYGIDPIVIHPGVSREQYESVSLGDKSRGQAIRERHGIATDAAVVTTVNRLDPRKRIGLLLRAGRRLVEDGEDVHLLVIGTGEDRERLRSLATELDIAGRVTFTGFVQDDELPDYYLASDVVSYQIWGSWGLVPLEALSLNRNVIVCSDSGPTELGDYFDQNVFVADPNVDAFASTLRDAITTEPGDVRQTVFAELSWERYFERVEAEIAELQKRSTS